ncbi:MAG: hypothetical protein ABJF11_15310 [Reichenbachiella sp.]|uniref:sodium:solute symporter family protein n=1 Tax=Reichenbachiella sp. TaxID=2184521 RepID=UPI0032630701
MVDQNLIIAVFLLFIVVGYFSKSGSVLSLEAYSMSRNKLNWFVISAGLSMSFAGGAALLNMASLGYSFGWQALVDPISFLFGTFIVFACLKFYRKDNGITISDLLSGTEPRLRYLIGAISSLVFILVVAAQFVAISKLLHPYFTWIASELFTLILAAITFGYVVIGGFKAVNKTDVIQLIVVFVFFITPFIFVSLKTESEYAGKLGFSAMPFDVIVLLGYTVIFIPFSQDINVRVKSGKSNKEARKGVFFGALFYCVIVVSAIYLGITLNSLGVTLSDPETAYISFFQLLSPGIGILAVIAAMSIILSSLDSFSLNAITSVARDLLRRGDQDDERKLILVSSFIVFSIAISTALYFNEILVIILSAILIYAAVLAPIALCRKFGLQDNMIFFGSVISIILLISIEAINTITIPYRSVSYPLINFIIILLIGAIMKMMRAHG